MHTRRLIKTFTWADEDRDVVSLGTSTRIDPIDNRAKLVAASGLFPLTVNLAVRSRLTNPTSLRRWTGFQVAAVHYLNEANVQVTSLGFRLSNGVSDFYFTAGSWVVAGVNNWNTEQQVADNIATFPVNPRQLQVVVNLVTTDARFTPELIAVKVLWESTVDFEEDILFRSLIPMIRSSVHPIGRALVALATTTATVPIASLNLEAGYNVVGVDSVFDETADAGHFTDIFVSYIGGVIALSAPITSGHVLFVNFIYEPEVAITTSQDYIEREKVPAILLMPQETRSPLPGNQADDAVVNKGTGAAVAVPAPSQTTIEIVLLMEADKAVDLARIETEVGAYFANNPTLRSTGLDERYRLWLLEEPVRSDNVGQKEIHMSRARFAIVNVCFWLKSAYDEQAARRLVLNAGLHDSTTPEQVAIPGFGGIRIPIN